MLSDYIEALRNCTDSVEREHIYHDLEKLGMDRVTAEIIVEAEKKEQEKEKTTIKFKHVPTSLNDTFVVYEERTEVMYVVSEDGALSPLFSTNGLPLTYSKWLKMGENG